MPTFFMRRDPLPLNGRELLQQEAFGTGIGREEEASPTYVFRREQ